MTLREWLRVLVWVVPLFGGFSFGVLGLIQLPGAAIAAGVSHEVTTSGARTTGTIVEVVRASEPTASRYGGGRTVWYPVTEQDLAGDAATKKWRAYTLRDEGAWTVGDELPVRYDPADPSRMAIDTDAARALVDRRVDVYTRLLVLGVALFAVGVGAEAARRRWLPTDEDALRRRRRAASRAARARRRFAERVGSPRG